MTALELQGNIDTISPVRFLARRGLHEGGWAEKSLAMTYSIAGCNCFEYR